MQSSVLWLEKKRTQNMEAHVSTCFRTEGTYGQRSNMLRVSRTLTQVGSGSIEPSQRSAEPSHSGFGVNRTLTQVGSGSLEPSHRWVQSVAHSHTQSGLVRTVIDGSQEAFSCEAESPRIKENRRRKRSSI